MSAALRQAVRDLLREAEDHGPIHDESSLGRIRTLLRRTERASAAPEPVQVHAHELDIARLVDALSAFKKIGGHFVGCGADKDGRICSASCRRAQAALERRHVTAAAGTVDAHLITIRALEQERRELQRTIAKLETLAGLVKRPRGRPRKRPVTQTMST